MIAATHAETSEDLNAIRGVNRLAFGGEGDARLIDALRAEGHQPVDFEVFVTLIGQVPPPQA
jgi:predicted N-acetyltransferase YhbS